MMLRDTRLQFFLTLGMLGTVLPYVSVFFVQAGLGDKLIGTAFAIYGFASVCSPALVGLVADRTSNPRRLLAMLNLFAAAILLMLSHGHGVVAVIILWTCYCLVSVPIFPLLNGIYFAQEQRRREAGETERPYHAARAWGSFGYVAVSLALFPLLHWGMALSGVLIAGGIIASCAAMQAMLLADPLAKNVQREIEHVPLFAATKTLLGKKHLAFTAAIILVCMSSQIHAAFYPVYITERVKIPAQWLGQASNVAVIVETGLIFGCGWLMGRLGVKKLVVACILITAVRWMLLAVTKNAGIAIGSQVTHGLMILAIGVVPQAFFNSHAAERFRHSVQGLFVMFTSAGQCLASFAAGFVAAYSLGAVYALAAGLCLVAAILVQSGFSESLVAARADDAKETAIPLGDVVPGAG